jgi:hypothetical protein
MLNGGHMNQQAKGIESSADTRVIAKFTGWAWYVTVGGEPLRDASGTVLRFESMKDASRAGHASLSSEAKR